MNKLLTFACALAFSVAAIGCATVCERKDRFLSNYCVGGDVAWSPDPDCEAKVENCGPGQKRIFEQYVSCLEQAKVCSLEVMSSCGQKYPGGVNLVC